MLLSLFFSCVLCFSVDHLEEVKAQATTGGRDQEFSQGERMAKYTEFEVHSERQIMASTFGVETAAHVLQRLLSFA